MQDKQTARREFLGLVGSGAAWSALSQLSAASGTPATSPAGSLPTSPTAPAREDGRFLKTASFLQKHLETSEPKLAFRPDMTADRMPVWQKAVREKLFELMRFPSVPEQPKPVRIWSKPRDGYRLERWEAYPEPYSVVPYYVLIPDGVSPQSPAPAVMCFPGTNGSKEALAGEPQPPGIPDLDKTKWPDNRMAYHYMHRGMVAIAVENPDTNELGASMWPRENVSLCALWMGRSYESISVFQKACILRWLIEQPYVDARRVATSGHSLGAKPADILAILFPDVVKAVVHNDFVCNWQERAVAVNLYCSSAFQIVPGILSWFDYTDLEAAMAPCPLLFTEGGRPNQIAKICRAYALKQAPNAVRVYHYEKYEAPASRTLDNAPLPANITMEQYYAYAYVDPTRHRFRPHRAVPWLAEVFRM